MAKVSFTSLVPIKGKEDKVIKFMDKEIVVKQYLPVKDKADLVSYIIQSSFDDNGLFSPVRESIYTTVGLLRWYTNINFTETMLINMEKTYDSIVLNKLADILTEIPTEEYDVIMSLIHDAVIETKDYLRSFAGQLRATQQDYDKTNFDLENIAATLQDEQQFAVLKNIMEKMG